MWRNILARPEDEAAAVHAPVSRTAECGQADVARSAPAEDGCSGDGARHHEEDGEERVPAEDVAHGQLVVAHANGLQAGRDLRQRRRRREHRRPEEHAGHVQVAGDPLAASREHDAARERHERRDREDRRGPAGGRRLLGELRLRMRDRLLLAVRRNTRLLPRQALARAVEQEQPSHPDDHDQHRGRLETRPRQGRRQLRSRNRDDEHGDDETGLEDEQERRRAIGERS